MINITIDNIKQEVGEGKFYEFTTKLEKGTKIYVDTENLEKVSALPEFLPSSSSLGTINGKEICLI